MDFEEPQPTKGRGKGKAKAKPKAKSAGTAGSRPGKGPCICCSEARRANARFCKLHKRSFDAMAYQAKKAEANGEAGAVEAFQNATQDDFSAKQAIEAFAEMNPPDSRYARKTFIDWADFKKTYGHRTEMIDRAKCKPMWEGEFMNWAQNEKALTKVEAEQWWKDYFNDPKIERDNDGYKGRLQLWIPTSMSKITDKARFIESAMAQGSKPMKEPTQEDISMLQTHVKRQHQSVVDPFFKGEPSSASSPAAGTPAASTPQTQQDADMDTSGADRETKRQKIDVDRAGPKLLKTMNKENASLKKTFETAKTKVAAATSALKRGDLDKNLFLDDMSLFGLLRALDLRLHFLERWDGNEAVNDKSFILLVQSWPDIAQSEASKKLVKTAAEDFTKTQAQSLEKLQEENKTRLPVQGNNTLCSNIDFENMMQKAAALASANEYEALKTDWQSKMNSAVAMFQSTTKIANDVLEHVATKERESKRQETRRATQERQAALKAIRDQAKDAADKIKAKAKETTQEPVFAVDFTAVGVPAVPELLAPGTGTTWTEPWVVKSWAAANGLLAEPNIKKSLDTFAAQYRKLGEASGRHQYNLQAGGVKDMVDGICKQAMPKECLDLIEHGVEGAEKFMTGSWFYGFSPGMTFCGLQPNAAAQLRVHAKGQVKILVLDLKSLSEKKVPGEVPFSKVHSYVNKMSPEILEDCKKEGVNMWAHVLSPGDLLFIPAGAITVEVCEPACGEVCGVRKSFFPLNATACALYKMVLQQFKQDGRNVGQMEAVAEGFTKSLA